VVGTFFAPFDQLLVQIVARSQAGEFDREVDASAGFPALWK
jgi:hypothetical protein